MDKNNEGFLSKSKASELLQKQLVSIIKECIIDVPENEISELYAKLQTRWDCPFWGIIERPDAKKINKNFYVPSNAVNIGIDLPIWYNLKDDIKQKKIMFVGIDPLRAIESVKEETVYFGSPYAFHNNKSTILPYRKALTALLATDVAIYFSDTFKLFYRSGGRQSRDIPMFRNYKQKDDRVDMDINQVIFEREVKAFKPDLVIAMGKFPLQWFSIGNVTLPAIRFKPLLHGKLVESAEKLYHPATNTRIFPIPHLTKGNIKALSEYWNAENKEIKDIETLMTAIVQLVKSTDR